MYHGFNVEIAKKYGVHEAVFIHNLYFWILKNECNGRHYYDGYHWTYNSLSALERLFPYFSRKQIRTIIANCIAKGAILKGNFNKDGYDNTSWFALTGDVLSVYQGGVSTDKTPCAQEDTPCAQEDTACAQRGTSCAQKGTTIPDSKPYSKPDIHKRDVSFEIFWRAYPKKKAKGDAFKAFIKLQPDNQLLDAMLKAIEAQKHDKDWQRDDGQYIPYPASWLNARRWEDERATAPANSERWLN